MARPTVKDPKKQFSCQLKASDIAWLKQTASDREMTINALVELGIGVVRAQLLPPGEKEPEQVPPKKAPCAVPEIKYEGLYIPTGSDC